MVLKNTSVELEASDIAALKALQKKTGASISAQVRLAVIEYIESRRKLGLLEEKNSK